MVLCCIVVIFATAGVLLFVSSQRATTSAASHREEAVAVEIDTIRLAINRAAIDEAVVRAGVAAGVLEQDDLDRAAQARSAGWSDAASRLRDLVGGKADAEAQLLLDLINNTDGRPVSLGELWFVSYESQFAERQVTSEPGSEDLDYFDHGYTLVFFEALVAETSRTGASTSILSAEDTTYLREEADYIAANAGYLGPDPSAPLANSWLVAEGVSESARFSAVNDLLASSNIWAIDQWTQAWADGSELPPPVDLFDEWVAITQGVAIIRDMVDNEADATLETARGAASASGDDASMARLGAMASALIALGSLIALAASIWQQAQFNRRLADTDALTGAGNRRRLDATSARLARTDLDHHLIATVDLDRFKLINDTHGHAMGDRILVELTHQLRSVVEQSGVDEGEVIRLGGDEFLLTLHHSTAIDARLLAARLEAVQNNVVTSAEGEPIPLTFSFGCVEATGSPTLPGLMDSADLKTYEDKERRRQNRAATLQMSTAEPAETTNTAR